MVRSRQIWPSELTYVLVEGSSSGCHVVYTGKHQASTLSVSALLARAQEPVCVCVCVCVCMCGDGMHGPLLRRMRASISWAVGVSRRERARCVSEPRSNISPIVLHPRTRPPPAPWVSHPTPRHSRNRQAHTPKAAQPAPRQEHAQREHTDKMRTSHCSGRRRVPARDAAAALDCARPVRRTFLFKRGN
jgi:hypothetical protein